MSRILVLSPHVDDGEIGCGGSIARMVEQGDEVFYVAFSDARVSVPEGFPEDALVKELGPEKIFTPTREDVHQDHQTVTQEALRAFKRSSATILGYEEPWNCFNFSTSAFVHLTEEHVEKKLQALEAYKSQAHRGYLNRDFVFGLAQTRGTQIGARYAEAFELIRYVME